MVEKRGGSERQAEILKVLGHPVRLQIIQALADKPWCVCELAEELDVRQPYLSQQLAYLRRAEVVSGTKAGLQVQYRIEVPHVKALLKAIVDVASGA